MSLYGSAFPQAAYPGYAAEPGPFARSHAGASYAGANYAGANYVDVCPGPPIQVSTTGCCVSRPLLCSPVCVLQTKPGPDGLMGPSGANLFVFHIPSEFTNVDMYNLFQHYGELVSVRIMTEVSKTQQARSSRMLLFTSPRPHTRPHTHPGRHRQG